MVKRKMYIQTKKSPLKCVIGAYTFRKSSMPAFFAKRVLLSGLACLMRICGLSCVQDSFYCIL